MSDQSFFTQVNVAALQSAGKTPNWTAVNARDTGGSSNAIPESGSDGVPLLDTITVHVVANPRENPARRTARILYSSIDLTAVQVVTVDGNAVTYNGAVELPANVNEAVIGIADAINADGTVGPLVTATAVDASDNPSTTAAVTVKIEGAGAADYSLDVTLGGTTTAEVLADAKSFQIEAWALPSGTGSGRPAFWSLARNGLLTTLDSTGAPTRTIDTNGLTDIFTFPGKQRLYIRTTDWTEVTGDNLTIVDLVGTVAIGPTFVSEG